LLTCTAALNASEMAVNARVDPNLGELRVRILDEAGRPLPGFDWEDCPPIKGDRVDHPVAWKSDTRAVQGKPVRFEFRLKHAAIFSFDLK
jgi:hypothetical protein